MLSKKGIHLGAYPIEGIKKAPILASSCTVNKSPELGFNSKSLSFDLG